MEGIMESFVLDNRRCACFVPEKGAGTAAYLCGWNMEAMLPALAKEAPGVLLFFTQADGGRDFTPWRAAPVWEGEPFSGGGADFLRFLTATAAPHLHTRYGVADDPAQRAILGYSLGGLFALWSLCETDFFRQGASISGSLWYPGFSEYFRRHLPRPAQRVYLSLGDREPFGGPPALRSVGRCTAEAAARLKEAGRSATMEWNRGGHAKGVENRWKKADRSRI